MTIKQFSDIIESYKPTGWDYYATADERNYNTNRDVDNVMICKLPNPWPLNWRDLCKRNVSFTLLFGYVVPLKPDTGTQQHDNYSAIEIRDTVADIVNTTLAALSEDANVMITTDGQMTFYDAPEGKSVNSQVWAEVQVQAVIFEKAEDTFVVDESGNYITDESGNQIIL